MNKLVYDKARRAIIKAPKPKEEEDHIALVELIVNANALLPGWRFTHVPNGEKRDKATAAKLKLMGVSRGVPDLLFFGPNRNFALELKRSGTMVLTLEQMNWRDHLIRCGWDYLATNSVQIAVDTLVDLGIIRHVTVSA